MMAEIAFFPAPIHGDELIFRTSYKVLLNDLCSFAIVLQNDEDIVCLNDLLK